MRKFKFNLTTEEQRAQRPTRRKLASVPLCLFGCFIFFFGVLLSPATGQTITVSAAISLKDALTDAAKQYQKQSGESVRLNFGASGDLANQIVAGAPVDLFISAGESQIKQLERAKLIVGTPAVVARNELVLIVPRDRDHPESWKELVNANRIAIGDPKAVPAGQYATEVFEHLGLLEKLKDKLIYGANVRQVLAYVERGEVDAGIVYATDAKQAGAKVRVVDVAAVGTHEPVEYPAAIIRGGDEERAEAFLDFLGSAASQQIFIHFGFARGQP